MTGLHKAAISILLLALLLAVIVPFAPRPARAITYDSTYDFVGITSPSGTHVTTSGNLTIDSLNSPVSYAEGTFAEEINERKGPGSGYSALEVDNAGYNAIESSDDSRYATAIPAGSDNAALWHEFNIAIDPVSITRLDIKWEGYQGNSSSGSKLWVMVWNYEFGVFHVLNASAQTSDYEYTGSITTNCDHFISSGSTVTVLAYNDISGEEIYCDYVEIVVTYGPPFTSTFNTTLTGWGWSPDEQRGIGNVSFPVDISAVPRTDAPESSDINFFGTLNLTYNDNTTRTFPLNLVGVKTRSLFHLRENELDTNGEAVGAAFNGPWLTWNTSGVEEHYIGGAATIWLPNGTVSKTFKPYYFLLRTPAVNISVGTLGIGFVANLNYFIYSMTRGVDVLFTGLMAGNFRDSLGGMLDKATVIIKEVRDRLGPYIP